MRKSHPVDFLQTKLILLATATTIMEGAYQLTAGSIDIITTRTSGYGHNTLTSGVITKAVNRILPRTAVDRMWIGIERNQVQLAGDVTNQCGQLARMLETIVDAIEHNVLESYLAALVSIDITVAGPH